MYLEHFGLSEFPFTTASDPRYFYPTAKHREALACLLYTVEQRRGLALITGEIGAGKTMLCRAALGRFEPTVQPIFVVHTSLSPQEFIQTVAAESGIETTGKTKVELLRELRNALLVRHRHGATVVLLLDEAQGLSDDVLEEVRLLTNLETGSEKLLQIILVGQPELRRRIAGRDLRALDQRVAVKFHLSSLSSDEVAQYVDHRLRVAGASKPAAVFAPEAKARVFRSSAGVPRIINVICDQALLDAYGRGQDRVTSDTVRRVVREIEGYYMLDEPAPAAVEASDRGQEDGTPAGPTSRRREGASASEIGPPAGADGAPLPSTDPPTQAISAKGAAQTPVQAADAGQRPLAEVATVEELCALLRSGGLGIAFRTSTDDEALAAYWLNGLEVRVQFARVDGENYVILSGDTGRWQKRHVRTALVDEALALGYVRVTLDGYLRSSGQNPCTLELSGGRLGLGCQADREPTRDSVVRHIRDLHEDMRRMVEAALHPEPSGCASAGPQSEPPRRRRTLQDGRSDRQSRLECPHCGRVIGVFADEVGTLGNCPGCSAAIEVSAELFRGYRRRAALNGHGTCGEGPFGSTMGEG